MTSAGASRSRSADPDSRRSPTGDRRDPGRSGVASPRLIRRRTRHLRAGSACQRDHLIDLRFRAHVVRELEAGGPGRVYVRHRRERCPRPQRKLQALAQLEEDDRAVLELLADDPIGRPAEAVPIEGQRSLQILDTQGDEGDPRFHQRRGRDSNPRGFRLPLFESGTINHSDTSPRVSLWAALSVDSKCRCRSAASTTHG